MCRVLGEAAGMGSIERFIDSKEGRDGGGRKARGERGDGRVPHGCLGRVVAERSARDGTLVGMYLERLRQGSQATVTISGQVTCK